MARRCFEGFATGMKHERLAHLEKSEAIRQKNTMQKYYPKGDKLRVTKAKAGGYHVLVKHCEEE